MKIELHAHHLTPKMYDIDDDPRAPYWKGQEMMVGSWVMRQKKFPESQQITAEDPGTKLFERMDHPFRREMMAKFGVDVLVVSNTPLTYYYWAEEFGVRYATLVNDELAAWCDEDPSTFLWWAQVPMHEPTAAAKELERAVGLGAVGFMSGGAEMGGRNLHDPEMDELWAKAVELDVPMFIHGAAAGGCVAGPVDGPTRSTRRSPWATCTTSRAPSGTSCSAASSIGSRT